MTVGRARVIGALLVASLAAAAAVPRLLSAQPASLAASARTRAAVESRAAALRRDWPELYARLIGLERAHGVFYGALAGAKRERRERGADRKSIVAAGKPVLDEPAVFRALVSRSSGQLAPRDAGGAVVDRPDVEADKGYAALGQRAAEIIRRGHAFHREVLAIFAGVEFAGRQAALDDAVARYSSRLDVSLPDTPKDMTILYDHPYTSFTEEGFNPRRALAYPTLTGFVWAAHWFQLAAQEPFDVAGDPAQRAAGLRTVTERFERKLTSGKAPDAFPTELPLAPSIAPGLVTAHERAAAIIDNLHLLHEVLAEILVHPDATNPRGAIDAAVALFTDRGARIVAVDDWIKMALRHSIFEQGGPALMVMTQSDRNASGHAQHARGGRAIPPGGMR